MLGKLVSFRDGWGLVESPSLPEKLFCHSADNPQITQMGIVPGDEVSFEMGTNPTNGRSKATSVQLLVKEQSELLGRRVTGVVQKFRDGWGFAASSKFAGTILLGKRSITAAGLGWLQEGTPVEFEVAAGQAGKFEAVKIAAAGAPEVVPYGSSPSGFTSRNSYSRGSGYGGAFDALVGATMRDRSRTPRGVGAGMVGKVRMFRDGWGFITSDGFPGDIFVSQRDNASIVQPLQAGEILEFELDHRPGGSHNGARAVNVRRPRGGGFGSAAGRPSGGGFGAAGQQKQSGTMSSIKDGWGFVDSASGWGSVFLGLKENPHLSQLPAVGDQLIFDLASDPKSGRYKALNVEASPIGKRVQGTVTSVRNGGLWGFAEGSVMLGTRNLMAAGIESLQVGDVFEYDLNTAAKGYEAMNITKVLAKQ